MNRNKITKIAVSAALGIIGISLINSCSVKIPKGAVAEKSFEVEKYMGKWYEIARLDFRFEKNLNNTTAQYSINSDGTVKVDNRGYDYVKNEWNQSMGEARFIGDKTEARLKVTFFKPFWAGYNVIDLIDYEYALVAGNSLKYLWILSRKKTIPLHVKQRFLNKAENLGYDTSNLIWVEHN